MLHFILKTPAGLGICVFQQVSDNANPPNVLREQEMFIVVVHPFIADTFNPLSTLDPYPETDDKLPEGFHPETGPFHPAKRPVLSPGDSFDETLPDEFEPFPVDEVPRDSRRGGLSEDVYTPPEELIPKPIDLRNRGLPEADAVSPGSRGGRLPGRGVYEGREDEVDLDSRGGFPGGYGGRDGEDDVDSRRFPGRGEYGGRDDGTDLNSRGRFPGEYGGRDGETDVNSRGRFPSGRGEYEDSDDEFDLNPRRFPGGYGGRDDETDVNLRRRLPGGYGDRDGDKVDTDTRWRYPSGRDLYDSDEDETEANPRGRYLPTHETFESEEEEIEPTGESGRRGELPNLYELATHGAVPTIALGVNLGMVVSTYVVYEYYIVI